MQKIFKVAIGNITVSLPFSMQIKSIRFDNTKKSLFWILLLLTSSSSDHFYFKTEFKYQKIKLFLPLLFRLYSSCKRSFVPLALSQKIWRMIYMKKTWICIYQKKKWNFLSCLFCDAEHYWKFITISKAIFFTFHTVLLPIFSTVPNSAENLFFFPSLTVSSLEKIFFLCF